MKNISFIYIILAGVLWGTSGIFVHFLAPYGFSALQMTFIRSFVTFFVIGIYILIFNKKLFKITKKKLLLFLGSGASFLGTASCYYHSMQLTSISTAVVLMYTAPIFVMIYSVAFLGERLTKLKFVSIVGMILGCGLVSGIIGGLKFDLLGIIFGFLSGISYSAYNIFTKINMRNNANPITATFYCFLFASIIGFFISNSRDLPILMELDLKNTIPLCIGLGLFTCILPYFLYTLALKEIPAGTAASLGIIEPLSATVFSVVLFKEPLTILSVLGMILILGSVFILHKQKV